MTIQVSFTNSEAIRALFAITSSVERSRKFCQETDKKYGDMNNIYRDQIHELRGAHKVLIEAIRKEGFTMSGADIPDDPIDSYLK